MDWIEEVVTAFRNIINDIDKGSSEMGVRRTFEELFLRNVLGYERKDIKWEKRRADLTIMDENDFAVIKIETKKPTENIDRKDYEEQAFKYVEETTRYIGLTNFLRLKVWEIKRKESEPKVDLDFGKIMNQLRLIKVIRGAEKAQILFLNNLSKDVIFDPGKYDKFDETYARIDITQERGFSKLLDRLDFVSNTLLLGHVFKAFGEYKNGYARYKNELEDFEQKIRKNKRLNQDIVRYKQILEDKYKKYLEFSGFHLWKQYSGKEDFTDEEVKETFCKETIYVFLNKLLFLRICEDKNFLEKNISNGGLEQLREFLMKRFDEDVINKEILELAFRSASGLYSHFYETGILDWFRTGDGELNEILNRVLWTLNQFDFAHVDRDILGSLYEKYLPNKERKKLGEFYTPVEVIDYILTSVGYTYSYAIEDKDLLDPACGSGGFLVRAVRRLTSRFLMKFGKASKQELRDPRNWGHIVSRLSPEEAKIILEAIQEHVYGLDINPFACHIAEMNMLFQVIDLYQKVREENKNYKLERFRIYRTDSLEKETQKEIWDYIHRAFLEEQEAIEKIKKGKFDFVVGNPPYVRVQLIDEKTRKYLTSNYRTAFKNFDLYVVFIERALNWLDDNGKFGFITSNQFMKRSYGAKLRQYILENSEIISIVDFGRTKIFQDVTNYPTIMVFRRGKPSLNLFKFIRVKEEKQDLMGHIFFHFRKKEYFDECLDVFEIEQNKLDSSPWSFSPKDESLILEKIDEVDSTLEDVSNIVLGLQTGKDKLLTGRISREISKDLVEFSSKEDKAVAERELLKPLLRGREVRKWKIDWLGSYVFFPHRQTKEKMEPIGEKNLEQDCSNAYQFLKKNERKIRSRKWYGKTAEELHGIWYSLMYYEQTRFYDCTKILTPALTDRNNFAIDEDGYFFVLGTAGVYGIVPNDDIDIKYLLGVLNSKVSEFYLKNTCPIKQGGYFQYSTKYLEKLPIRLPRTSTEKRIAGLVKEKMDRILELMEKSSVDVNDLLRDKEVKKLYSYPSVSFNIKDDAELEDVVADQNKVFLSKDNYIEVKDRQLRDYVVAYLKSVRKELINTPNIKSYIYNLRVPESNEIINEIIEMRSLGDIREEILKYEEEINDLVCKMYGLSDEEREILDRFLA